MQRRPRCVQHWSNPQNAAELLQAVSDAEDLEFEEVGSDITAAPESPAACDQQVNQAELPPQANLVRHPLRSVGVYEHWPSFNRTDSRLGALRHIAVVGAVPALAMVRILYDFLRVRLCTRE
jgi:hypothetical protein